MSVDHLRRFYDKQSASTDGDTIWVAQRIRFALEHRHLGITMDAALLGHLPIQHPKVRRNDLLLQLATSLDDKTPNVPKAIVELAAEYRRAPFVDRQGQVIEEIVQCGYPFPCERSIRRILRT